MAAQEEASRGALDVVVDAVDAVVRRPEHPLGTHSIASILDQEGGTIEMIFRMQRRVGRVGEKHSRRRSFGGPILPFEGDLVGGHVGRRGED
jgi:hypothetical protein